MELYYKIDIESLALIKITKSPYQHTNELDYIFSLALIKITKSPYQTPVDTGELRSLALIKITKSPYLCLKKE